MKQYLRLYYVIPFLLSLSTSLIGGIEEHFKPVADKSGFHSICNVDFVYMINLDHRPEKFSYCSRQLERYGISPCRFSAVHGWELSDVVLNELGVPYQTEMGDGMMATYYFHNASHAEPLGVPGKTYFCYGMTKGAVGIVLSHLSILQDAYDSGYETIWIMEDDIELIRNPHLVSEAVEHLDQLVGKGEWDILFTDRDTKGKDGKYVVCRSFAPRPNYAPKDPMKFAKEPQQLNDEFQRIFARYGSYSMVIRRSGMKKLLDFFKTYHLYLPYDMDFYLPDDINLFSVLADIVSTQPDAISDNSAPAG